MVTGRNNNLAFPEYGTWYFLGISNHSNPKLAIPTMSSGAPAGSITRSNKSSGLEVWEIKQYLAVEDPKTMCGLVCI